MARYLRVRFFDEADDRGTDIASSAQIAIPDGLSPEDLTAHITMEVSRCVRQWAADECAAHFGR